jgi:hypothetical protein
MGIRTSRGVRLAGALPPPGIPAGSDGARRGRQSNARGNPWPRPRSPACPAEQQQWSGSAAPPWILTRPHRQNTLTVAEVHS